MHFIIKYSGGQCTKGRRSTRSHFVICRHAGQLSRDNAVTRAQRVWDAPSAEFAYNWGCILSLAIPTAHPHELPTAMAHNTPSGSSLRSRPSTAQAGPPTAKDEDTGLALFRSLYHESVRRICGAYALQVVKALWYVGVDREDRDIFVNEANRQRKSTGPSSSYFVGESRRIGAKVLTPQKVLEACAFDFFYSYSPGGFGITTKKRKRRPYSMAEVAETWQAGSKEAKDGMFRLALQEVGSVKTGELS